MSRALRLALAFACVATLAHAQSSSTVVTGPSLLSPRETLALVGGTVHPVSSAAIPGGTVIVENGRIAAVGAGVAPPAGARVIDCTGKHVYPGLVSANTRLGLIEMASVLGSDDTQEQGGVNPNVRAEVQVNPESDLLPVARLNGITSALVVPRGGTITGTSALMHLAGWTTEDMTVRAPVALHVTWPNMSPVRNFFFQQSDEDQAKAREQAIGAIRGAFDDARAYWTARAAEGRPGVPAHDADVKWDAMRRVFAGEIPVVFAARTLAQIRAVLQFADEQKLPRVILLGGDDAPLVADELKARDVPVIVAGVLAVPRHRWDEYDAAYALPARLAAAGLRWCIADEGGNDDTETARNLPYHAAMAASFDLDHDEALKAITLYPAQILGVADRVGSIEVGKDADLQVTSGDPLEITTQVEQVVIGGRAIEMESRQTRLWHKYDAKPRGAKARPR